MYFDKVQGPWMMGATVVGVPALIGGWYLVRGRVAAAAQAPGAGDAASVPVVELEDRRPSERMPGCGNALPSVTFQRRVTVVACAAWCVI